MRVAADRGPCRPQLVRTAGWSADRTRSSTQNSFIPPAFLKQINLLQNKIRKLNVLI